MDKFKFKYYTISKFNWAVCLFLYIILIFPVISANFNTTTEKVDIISSSNSAIINEMPNSQGNTNPNIINNNKCLEQMFGEKSSWRHNTEKVLIKKGVDMIEHLNNFSEVGDSSDPMDYFVEYGAYCQEKVVNKFNKWLEYDLKINANKREDDLKDKCRPLLCPPLYNEHDQLCIFPYFGPLGTDKSQKFESSGYVMLNQPYYGVNVKSNQSQNHTRIGNNNNNNRYYHHLVNVGCHHGLVGKGHTLRCDTITNSWVTTWTWQELSPDYEYPYYGDTSSLGNNNNNKMAYNNNDPQSETNLIKIPTFIDENGCNILNDEEWKATASFIDNIQIFLLIFAGLSISTLLPAVFIYLYYPNLRCTKNYIHANLMISFILRIFYDASSQYLNHWLHKQYMMLSYPNNINLKPGQHWPYMKEVHLINSTSLPLASSNDRPSSAIFYQISCIFWTLLGNFAQMANYFWLMNEGIYLYNLLNLTRMLGDCTTLTFIFIGWCIPLMFIFLNVTIHLIQRYHMFSQALLIDQNIGANTTKFRRSFVNNITATAAAATTTTTSKIFLAKDYDNQLDVCWESSSIYTNLVRIPILISVFVNFIIFIAVTKTISSKMKRDVPGGVILSIKNEEGVNLAQTGVVNNNNLAPGYRVSTSGSLYQNQNQNAPECLNLNVNNNNNNNNIEASQMLDPPTNNNSHLGPLPQREHRSFQDNNMSYQTLNLIPDLFTPAQLIESVTQLLNLIRLGLVSIQLNLIHFGQKFFFGPVLVKKLSILLDSEVENSKIW